MKRDGGQQGRRAGRRAGGRQAMHTCDPFTLRTSHGPSPPQWATAAKQAKCRQTFDSAWVPCIRTPGVGQFEQGGGRGLAGVGARGWTCGQLSLLEIAFPGLLRCGDFQNSLPPRRIAGFLDVRMSASDPRKPAAAPPQHPEMEVFEGKSQKKGVCLPQSATADYLGLPGPSYLPLRA